jgi:hypothetical protein
MRTTLDIAGDVLAAVKELARRQGRTAVRGRGQGRLQRTRRRTAGSRRSLMRGLLDVNVLIALLDSAHVHHRLAMAWLGRNIGQG